MVATSLPLQITHLRQLLQYPGRGMAEAFAEGGGEGADAGIAAGVGDLPDGRAARQIFQRIVEPDVLTPRRKAHAEFVLAQTC